MSLWTPDGEHEVPREPRRAAAPASSEPERPTGPSGGAADDLPAFDDLSPEQQEQVQAMAAELAEARRRLAETPAAEVVANHAMGLYELAAIHLSSDEPDLADAKLSIDAMAAVMTSCEGRLGQHEPVLRDALAQLQLAYVQVRGD